MEEPLRFAMICASNMNRSMEAHFQVAKVGLFVASYGVGTSVKLPGPTQDQPNVYPFGTPYEEIYRDLLSKDREMYTRNGLTKMLERNISIKRAPQRWQMEREAMYDVAITFEKWVFDRVCEDMESRQQVHMKALLVVNMDVKDNAEEAATAGQQAVRLCRKLQQAGEEWETQVDDIMDEFEKESGRRPLYMVFYY